MRKFLPNFVANNFSRKKDSIENEITAKTEKIGIEFNEEFIFCFARAC